MIQVQYNGGGGRGGTMKPLKPRNGGVIAYIGRRWVRAGGGVGVAETLYKLRTHIALRAREHDLQYVKYDRGRVIRRPEVGELRVLLLILCTVSINTSGS